MRVLCVFATLLSMSTMAVAACPTAATPIEQNVGKKVWVVQSESDYPTVGRFAAEHRGFQVRPQVQIGPTRWEGDRNQEPVLMGTTGTVISVAGNHSGGDPWWFNVRLDDGREVVLYVLQFETYDYRECDPMTLLNNRGDTRYAKQWMWYLPLKLKDGARPVDHVGEWIDQKYLDQVQILDCTSYNYYASIHPDQFDCAPVWKDGADVDPRGLDYDTPTHFYPTADMVEHATIEDLTR